MSIDPNELRDEFDAQMSNIVGAPYDVFSTELKASLAQALGNSVDLAVEGGVGLAHTFTGADANVTVAKNGSDVSTRGKINLIEGTNVTLTVADNAGQGRADVTIDTTGGALSVVKTSDEVRNNNDLFTVDSDLVLVFPEVGWYTLVVRLTVESTTSADMIILFLCANCNSVLAFPGLNQNVAVSSPGSTIPVPGINARKSVTLEGYVEVTLVGAVFSILWRQSVAEVSDATIFRGSHLSASKLD